MTRTKKKPKAAFRPAAKRTPKIDGKADGETGLLAWRVGLLDLDGRWGWRTLRGGHVDDLRGVLVDAERTPIRNLIADRRLKEIPVRDICAEAKKRLADVRQDDVDSIWELRRLSEKRRAWGFLESQYFYVLWWDPDHTVCDPPPRGVRRR